MLKPAALVLTMLSLGLVAASPAHAANCVPGTQIACACLGGRQGIQVCSASGSRFEPCVCEASPLVPPPPPSLPTYAAPPAATGAHLPFASVTFADSPRDHYDVETAEPLFRTYGCGWDSPGSCVRLPLVLVPIDPRNTTIDEPQHARVAAGLAADIEAGLRDRLERSGRFSQILAQCPGDRPAVRLETTLESLLHHHGRFTAKLATRIVDCGTGELLTAIDFAEESDHDVSDIAHDLVKHIQELRSKCRSPCTLRLPAGDQPVDIDGRKHVIPVAADAVFTLRIENKRTLVSSDGRKL